MKTCVGILPSGNQTRSEKNHAREWKKVNATVATLLGATIPDGGACSGCFFHFNNQEKVLLSGAVCARIAASVNRLKEFEAFFSTSELEVRRKVCENFTPVDGYGWVIDCSRGRQ